MFNFSSLFKTNEIDFRPYSQKENDFKRLALINAIVSFVIAPIFCFLIKDSEISIIYFYLGLSYTILFPIYIIFCWFFEFFRDKLFLFFIFHIFGMTFFAYLDLVENNFQIIDLFSFYCLFSISIFVIQRFYYGLIYIFYVLVLIVFSFQFINRDLAISKEIIIGFIFALSLSSLVALYARNQMLLSVFDFNSYLKRLSQGVKFGFVLFKIENDKIIVLDFNDDIRMVLSDNKKQTKIDLSNIFNERLSFTDIRKLKTLNEDEYISKIVKIGDQDFEMVFSHLIMKKFDYFLVKTNNITDRIKEREELIFSEEKYRNLYNENQAGIFTLNKSFNLVNFNKTFEVIFEGTYVIGHPFLEDDVEMNDLLALISNTEKFNNYQTHITLKNGTVKWLVFNFYYDEKNNLIEGSVIDVSEIQKASNALRKSEEKYKLIYEESNDAIVILDGDKVTDVNRRGMQMFGIPKDEFFGLNLWDLSHDMNEELANQLKIYKNKLRQVGTIKFSWIFSGRFNPIEAEVAIVELVIGKSIVHQCVIHDVTEKNQTIRALMNSTKNFESALDSAPEGIFIVNNYEILYANKECYKMVDSPNVDVHQLFIGKDQLVFDELLIRVVEERKAIESRLNLNVKGSSLLVDVTIVNTVFGSIDAILVLFKDVTAQVQLSKEVLRAELAEETSKKLSKEIEERIKAEKEIQNLLLKTQSIYDSSSNIFLLTLDAEGKVTYFNKQSARYFLETSQQKIKVGAVLTDFFTPFFSKDLISEFKQILKKVFSGSSRQFEIEFNHLESHIWVEIFLNPIYDTDGNISEVSLIWHDISIKKMAENEIIDSLKEKEVLLKEIHHRVKNNLQVISSILNLQSSFVQDPKTLSILQESRNRIRSMAIIHENLYRTTNFSSIDFEGYLQNLVLNLMALFNREDLKINIVYDLQPVEISIDQAVPSGLIMNELITNALKYAFEPATERYNEILISMHELDGTIQLRIKDNGSGLSNDFDIMRSDTLGLQLVVTLAEQLDAKLEFKNDNGTDFLISFEKM